MRWLTLLVVTYLIKGKPGILPLYEQQNNTIHLTVCSQSATIISNEGRVTIVQKYGPGYRVYFEKLENNTIVLILRGGTKKTQKADIKKVKKQNEEK